MAIYTAADNKLFSGTLDGSTYQRNHVVRNWVYPTNTFSTLKQFQIECISNYSRFWQSLTQDEMIMWHNYSYTHHDSFSHQIVVTGMQAFIGINSNLAMYYNDNTSIYHYVPVLRNRSLDIIELFTTAIDSSSYIVYNVASFRLHQVAFYSTVNVSPGVFKPRRCDFYFCGFVNISSGSTDILVDFNNRFAFPPNVGSKIFTRLIPFDNISGTYSTVFQTSAVVS